jgi:hypothetical protein
MAKKGSSDPEVKGTEKAKAIDDDDVEGHAIADPWSAIHLAEARERDIKEAYRRKALEEEARRPHRKTSR